MKPQTLQTMCPGIEATSDCLVFLAQSDHDPKIKYRVDLAVYDGGGKCSCSEFEFRKEPFLRAGKSGQKLLCKHIIRSHLYHSIEVNQIIIKQRMEAANANRKANREKPVKYNAELPVI
jgi:hypothetical protein